MALLVFLLLLPAVSVYASPDIMPVDKIQPGMLGIGKTVVSGTKIEDFDVEVLSVMKDKGPTGDLILVRVSGDVIDRTGGIVQGMSGSPVYIDGKLVGAVAFGWPFTDHKVGMVTPIADMLKLWDIKDSAKTAAVDETQAQAASSPDMEQEATPLMVSGFSQQSLAMLKEKLTPFHLVPYAVGETSQDVQSGPLEPGSPIGVQLISGDVNMSALGTVTYVEGNKVLAFGHPFLKKGNANYLMTNAYIFTTVQGMENGFKVGTTGQIIGTINQDRGSGIAGETGRYPSIIPLRITVTDNNLGRTQDLAAHVVQDEQLSPVLTATTIANAMEKTMDRTGAGTARISFEISARNMPGEVLKRENMFYSPANIGEGVIGEFLEAMAMLAGNQYNPVDIMDVKVNVSVDEERHTASISEARASASTVKPGDKIDISVQLKPYRGETITRVVNYTIPKNQPAGPMILEVRGGGMVPLIQLLKRQGLDGDLLKAQKGNPKSKTKSFDSTIKEFTDRDRNNDIVVEIFDTSLLTLGGNVQPKETQNIQLDAESEAKTDGKPKKGANPAQLTADLDNTSGTGPDKGKSYLTTDYIIDGDYQVTVNVIKDDTK